MQLQSGRLSWVPRRGSRGRSGKAEDGLRLLLIDITEIQSIDSKEFMMEVWSCVYAYVYVYV